MCRLLCKKSPSIRVKEIDFSWGRMNVHVRKSKTCYINTYLIGTTINLTLFPGLFCVRVMSFTYTRTCNSITCIYHESWGKVLYIFLILGVKLPHPLSDKRSYFLTKNKTHIHYNIFVFFMFRKHLT